MFRVHQRFSIIEKENPSFREKGIYFSDNQLQTGAIFYLDNGQFKLRDIASEKVSTLVTLQEDHISLGTDNTSSLPGSVIIGDNAGSKLLSGSDLIILGKNAGANLQNVNNLIAIGVDSLNDSSLVGESIGIGTRCMGECGKTEYNIGIGREALLKINDSYNIGVGVESGRNIQGPLMNHLIIIGRECMKSAEGSGIGMIAMGTKTAENMKGNNFQSTYIGDKAAQNLDSTIVSVNNVGIGTEVLSEAKDISDMVVIGTKGGKKISGSRSVLLGSETAWDSTGKMTDEILIGTRAGSSREFQSSEMICIGKYAGNRSSGSEGMYLGNNAGSEASGNMNIGIGNRAGESLNGNDNFCGGGNAGAGMTGSWNVCVGAHAGAGMEGSKTVWIGKGPVVADRMNESVAVGADIGVKGNEVVAIGPSVGKYSIGYCNRDVLIGSHAGAGQKFNQDPEESRNLLLIGSNAGMGDVDNPENVNSGDLLCIGHSAGHSNDQSFHKSVMVGNYAGAFSDEVYDSVMVGHSAGAGMNTKSSVVIGAHSGINLQGERLILIGPHCGDQSGSLTSTFNDLLAIGTEKPTLLGDNKRGSLLIGAPKLMSDWTDGSNTLGFVSTERPTSVSSGVGGVLYCFGKHLEFATDKRSTLLTFPYRFVVQGELSGSSFQLNLDTDGATLLTFKMVPTVKTQYVLHEDLLLSVQNKVPVCPSFKSEFWTAEIVAPDQLKITCTESVKGIMYLEAVGVHILKKL